MSAALVAVVALVAGAALVNRPLHHGGPGTPGASGHSVVIAHTAPSAVGTAVAHAMREGTITWPAVWVATTPAGAAALIGAGEGVVQGPIYIVTTRGRFTLDGPQRDGDPTGSVLTVWVAAHGGETTGSGVMLNDQPVDLATYGTVNYYAPPN